jgi:multiple sugar transport system substrate-binding protein/sn-glycerol 3-phosphate transport system substrate-binding protein
MGIVPQSPEADLAAWIWLTYFTSPEVQAQWITNHGSLPTLSTTEQFMSDYLVNNPIYAESLQLLEFSQNEPIHFSWGDVRNQISESFINIVASAEAAIEPLLIELNATANEILAISD